jgi:hypothetical protein
MEVWPLIIGFLLVLITIFRVVMIIGVLMLFWCVTKGVKEQIITQRSLHD